MKYVNLLVRSIDRLYTTDTVNNFTTSLALNNGFKTVKEISLVHAWIPNTIYNVRTGINDSIVINHNGGGNTTVTLSAGVYSASSIATALGSALTTALGVTYTASVSSSTGLLTISNATAAFTLPLASWSSGATALYGFNAALGTVSSTGSFSVTGTRVPQLGQPSCILINMAPAGQNMRSTSQADRPTFLVPIDVNSGDVIVFNEKSYFKQCKFFENNRGIDMTYIQVQLNFPGGESVNLNGSDWQMVLKIKYELD